METTQKSEKHTEVMSRGARKEEWKEGRRRKRGTKRDEEEEDGRRGWTTGRLGACARVARGRETEYPLPWPPSSVRLSASSLSYLVDRERLPRPSLVLSPPTLRLHLLLLDPLASLLLLPLPLPASIYLHSLFLLFFLSLFILPCVLYPFSFFLLPLIQILCSRSLLVLLQPFSALCRVSRCSPNSSSPRFSLHASSLIFAVCFYRLPLTLLLLLPVLISRTRRSLPTQNPSPTR